MTSLSLKNPAMTKYRNRAMLGEMDASPGCERAKYSSVILKAMIYSFITLVFTVVSAIMFSAEGGLSVFVHGIYILLAMIVFIIPLSVIGIITRRFPKVAVVTAPIIAVFEGVVLGYFIGLIERFIKGFAIASVVSVFTVFFTVVILNTVLHKRSVNVLLRYIILVAVSVATAELCLFILSRFMEDYSILFLSAEGSIFAVNIVAVTITALWSVFIIMWHQADLNDIIGRGVDKKYEFGLSMALSELLGWIYICILWLIGVMIILLLGAFTKKKK